ncbi:hypothetical protein [Xanthobacter autotrophicus]|uniref:hypothetical protein n=1 Tax=Xanthobacter autotrophicus TaxID=280 RepID=UPI00372B0D37
MLGITVADSVLVGTLILSLAAFWQGKKDGATAAKAGPQVDGMKDLATAVRELTESIREGNDAKEVHALRERLERLERPR